MTENSFLELLNANIVTRDIWAAFLGADYCHVDIRPGQYEAAREKLLEAVDAWIDTGVQRDKSELPQKRNCGHVGVEMIFEQMKDLLSFTLVFASLQPEWLFALQSNPHVEKGKLPARGVLSVELKRNGGFHFKPVVYGGRLSSEEASALGFLIFWDSGLLYRLMRCASCRVYALPRNIKASYARGWRCTSTYCRKTAVAAEATREARNDRKREILLHAVAAYEEYASERKMPLQQLDDLVHRRAKALSAGSTQLPRDSRDQVEFLVSEVRKRVNDKLRKGRRTDRLSAGKRRRQSSKIANNTITSALTIISDMSVQKRSLAADRIRAYEEYARVTSISPGKLGKMVAHHAQLLRQSEDLPRELQYEIPPLVDFIRRYVNHKTEGRDTDDAILRDLEGICREAFQGKQDA